VKKLGAIGRDSFSSHERSGLCSLTAEGTGRRGYNGKNKRRTVKTKLKKDSTGGKSFINMKTAGNMEEASDIGRRHGQKKEH
jgi:hypothetical protein